MCPVACYEFKIHFYLHFIVLTLWAVLSLSRRFRKNLWPYTQTRLNETILAAYKHKEWVPKIAWKKKSSEVTFCAILFILLVMSRCDLVLYLCMCAHTHIRVHLPVHTYLEPDDIIYLPLLYFMSRGLSLNLGTVLRLDWLARKLPALFCPSLPQSTL